MKEDNKNRKQNEIRKTIEFNLIEVIVIILITGIVVSVCSGLIVYNNYDKIIPKNDSSEEESISELIESYNHIVNSYVKDVDKKGLIDSAIEGMYNYLNDAYSIYMDEDTTSSLNEQLEGTYEGVGIEISMNESMEIFITQVFESSPAEKAGIKEGDIITKLDNQDLAGKDSSYLANSIKKSDKKSFDITYLRNGVETTVKVTRNKVYINSVLSEKYDNVGYIKIKTFSATTTEQVTKILDIFDEKVNSIIIDLRNDTGGYLSSAYETADLFIEKGKIIYQLKDKDSKITKYKAKDKVYKKFDKIVVLINGGSASASEILALALTESAGAITVGEKSYGKGTVQETETLSSGAMVKYTTAYWLSPNGNSINETGIKPSVEVADEEQQLKKAIELAK